MGDCRPPGGITCALKVSDCMCQVFFVEIYHTYDVEVSKTHVSYEIRLELQG